MVIHLETLWEQAENLQNDTVENSIESIKRNLVAIQFGEAKEYHMGLLMMELCNISKQLNINTYTALQKAVTDKNSETLEQKYKNRGEGLKELARRAGPLPDGLLAISSPDWEPSDKSSK